MSSLPTSPCSCLSFPPSCPLRSGPFRSGLHVPIRLPFFSFSFRFPPLALSPPASRLLSCLSSPFHSLLLFLFSSPCHPAAVSFSLFAAPDLPFLGRFVPGRCSPGALRPRMFLSAAPEHPRTIQSGGSGRASFRPGCSNPGRLFVLFSPLPRTLQSVAPGLPPDDPVRGLLPCFLPPRMLQSGASFYRILSVASDAPVRGTGFTPGRSSPGASAALRSAPDAPILGVFLSYSLRCLGRSSPWLLVHPLTIQSGGLCRASFRPGCSNPGRLFIVFSPLPWLLLSVAPGSLPDDPVRVLVPRFMQPRMLQSGASFYRILSVASDAPVRGTGFTPGRSSLGASAVLHSSPDAPIRAVFLSYSLRCLGRSSPWHRVCLRTIQSGGFCLASCRPGCSNPGRLFIVFSPLPRTLQSVAPGSPPDDPVRRVVPCFLPPRMHQSGPSFYRILSVASDAPVRGTGFTPGRCSPGASAVLLSAPDAPIRAVFLSYSLRCLRCSIPGRLFIVFSPLLQSVAPGATPDNPVRGLVPCFIPPRMLPSGASFCHILSAASDDPIRGTGFTPDDPVRGLVPCFFPPRMLQSGASFYCFLSVASDAPVRGTGLAPRRSSLWAIALLHTAQMLQSGASFYRILSVASDAPVRCTGFTPGRSSPVASAVLLSAPDAPIQAVFLSYSLRCLGRSSPWHRVHPRTIQPGG